MGKTKTLRVHHLAKELGVPSKVILEKCRAEGIELKNHMAAVQLGLAASIREWFSEGADVTTVEVAEHVDLKKVKKATRKKKEVEPEVAEAAETAEASTAKPVGAPAAKAEPVPSAAPAEAETAPSPAVEPAAAAPAAEEAPASEVVTAATTETATSTEPPGEQGIAAVAPPAPAEPPPPPEPVKPAGPQVVPQPAELKGPRVVRIEAPEPVRPVRPRGAPVPIPGGRRGPMSPPPPAVPAQKRGRRGGPGDRTPSRARSPRRHGNIAEATERLREWRDQDVIERRERLASATGHGLKARRSAERRRKASGGASTIERHKEIEITAPIMIKDYCAAVGVPFATVGSKLIEQTGTLHRINDMIDAETAEMLAIELGVNLKVRKAKTLLEQLEEEFARRERRHLEPRPPIVAMLGHVDHGKTSLLDAIRKTDVAKGEAGGITQHIGAYRIDRDDWHVTFIDTPGHAAFTSMRARGAHLTDVVVLVVAADDGVMPQTVEAINHAKAAGVQIVIALNKIDLPNVDLNKVYSQLAEHDLAPAEWGGQTDLVKTSAATGEGVEALIEHLSTLSDLLDLKADPTVPAQGTVIEAQMREGRGVVAQVMVREGTLRTGQCVVCGPGAGRVRMLLDDRGKRVKEATPGTPVEIVGLDAVPDTGDTLYVVDSLSRAKEIANEVKTQRREASLAAMRKPQTLEDLLRQADEGEVVELNMILKADNRGSLEAIEAELSKFPTDKARLRILHMGVGAPTEADVSLAEASHAVIISFNVMADEHVRRAAEQAGVELRTYRVIYEITDDVQKALEGLLEPDRVEEARGRVEVREVFNITRVGRIAGCYVHDGVANRNCQARVLRDGRIVAEGLAIESLKRFKDDAREVRAGLECGIRLASFDDLKPGDVLELYEVVEVAQKL